MSGPGSVRLAVVAVLILGLGPGIVPAYPNRTEGSSVLSTKKKLKSDMKEKSKSDVKKKLKINHSTVRNDSGEKILIVWTAAGCAGVKYHHMEACASASLEQGESASYHYKWGATNDNIHIGTNVID